MDDTTPRERRHQRTRQSILDAARKIVVKRGAEELSIREIARQIDYSPAGLYEYFDSKEEIIQTLCSEGHQRLTASIQQVDPTLPPRDYLHEIGLAYIQFAVNNPEHYMLMFTNPPGKAQLEGMTSEDSSFPILLNAIDKGIEAGDFNIRPGFGRLEMAYAAWSLVHGISMLRITYIGDFPIDFSSADREVLNAFGRGLKSP